MRTCPSCEEGKLQPKRVENAKYNFRGESLNIGPKTVFVCNKCGEEITTAQEIQRIEKIAREKYLEMLDKILNEKSDERMSIRIPKNLKLLVEEEAKFQQRKPHQWVKWFIVKKLQEEIRK